MRSEGSGGYEEDDASGLAKDLFGGKLGVTGALTKLRNRLLDLSLRNRLLNYKHPKGRSFQFTNQPDLNLLFERLSDEKSVALAYVPEPPSEAYEAGKKPEARHYARQVGIGTSVDIGPPDLDSTHRRLSPLQVLHYPLDLERLARKLSSEARTVIEETGTNMLYLVFGFLEYFEDDESDKPIQAPLMAVPVNLTRGPVDEDTRTFTYELGFSGEDSAENITLREKLRQQFRLELPDLKDEDTPESYFSKISQAVSKRRNWTVKRRLSLAFLSFGKLAIWRDLDPNRSPELLSSKLLKDIFEGERSERPDVLHADDYSIDEHSEGELPLIYDADSSQHSAIIDVKSGKSLVINGPPGTGKSQTITNIIASAIATGKKVLFVSEKLAALEVVKQRLTAANLGDFCLELHSHKTHKKQLLEEVELRINGRYPAPAGYTKQLEALRERRKALNAYAVQMRSQSVSRMELSLHDVLWKAEGARVELGDHSQSVAEIIVHGAADWLPSEVDKARANLLDAATALDELGFAPEESPWRGFAPVVLVAGDEVPIGRVMVQVLDNVRQLNEEVLRLERLTQTTWALSALGRATEAVSAALKDAKPLDEVLLERMFADGISALSHVVESSRDLWQQLEHVRGLQARAAVGITRYDPDSVERLDDARIKTRRAIAQEAYALTCAALGTRLSETSKAIERVRQGIGGDDVRLPTNRSRLRAVLAEARLQPLLDLFDKPADVLSRDGDAASELARKTSRHLEQLSSVMVPAKVPFTGRIEEVQALLDGRGIPELLPDGLSDAPSLERLRELSAGGWGDWTAEEFVSRARDVAELIAAAIDASHSLQNLLSRLGLPGDLSPSAIESIEGLVALSETAPAELLQYRSPAMIRPDFADVAIRAEDLAKGITSKRVKLEAVFHADTVPEDSELKTHISVFRRGDSAINFLRSDWRAAKRAFKACSKEGKKLDARAMGERFTVLLSTNVAEREYLDSWQFRETFGALFNGVGTDFGRIRRLHAWMIQAQGSLVSGEFSSHVSALSIGDQHIAQLSASASKIRSWLSAIQRMSRALSTMPGLDPALRRVRRVDELFKPLDEYTNTLNEAATVLRQTVRPTASVSRAVELRELRARIDANGEQLKALVNAPAALANAFQLVGQRESPIALAELPSTVTRLQDAGLYVKSVGALISEELGRGQSIREATGIVAALDSLEVASHGLLIVPREPEQVAALLTSVASQVEDVQELLQLTEPLALPEAGLQQVLESIDNAREGARFLSLVERDATFNGLFGASLKGLDTDIARIWDCIAWGSALNDASAGLPVGAVARFLKAGGVDAAAQAAGAVENAWSHLQAAKAEGQALEKWGQIDLDEFFRGPRVDELLGRVEGAVASAGSIVPWSKYLAAKSDAQGKSLVPILAIAESGALPTRLVGSAFDYAFFRAIGRGAIGSDRQLSRFSGMSHDKVRDEFKEIDRALIELNGQMYANQINGKKKLLPGVSSGKASDLTEMALLLKEINKQKRHVPIRQLLSKAGHSLQQLKPCFMMGPLSVAQYLEQGVLKFDLVVMDEASQLRPEDALGAVARGRQLVVVGDPKQLPPTSFFDKMMEEDEDEQDEASAVVEGVESILGICEHLYRPVRTLRWHYRSRHESLIAFSNSQFYRGKLVVFPSPYARNRRLGVNYRYVANAIYKDRRNMLEAERVVDAVLEHIRTAPHESLGVVTLNQTQRELIDDLLDKRIRDFPGALEYLDRHKKDGWEFFVKNLENVQGDERDVIFVSTTFGKPAPGVSVRQRFGPISQSNGWRRLNVLFTRSRRRLDLFTSMKPSDVVIDSKASPGRRALRDYLEYAKTGMLTVAEGEVTEREQDSYFEEVVAEMLADRGYSVETQLGVAGYFLDVAVRHPDRPTEFLAGIECDGVNYHSSLSARDRDRIRQEVLESLGWKGRLIRIWSTDWFADPKGQTQRLVDFLQQRQASADDSLEPYSDGDLLDYEDEAENDEPAVAEVSGKSTSAIAVEQASDVAPTSQDAADSGPTIFVEGGDRVTYTILDGATETHTVHIVDSPSNPRLGLLNEDAPLARALLGYCRGDIAELHVPGQTKVRLRIDDVQRTQH